jgi:hypothetical protein
MLAAQADERNFPSIVGCQAKWRRRITFFQHRTAPLPFGQESKRFSVSFTV